MKVQFLGTAAGKPSNHRNVTSIAVIMEDSEFSLVDCGEATQHQLMKTSLKVTKLKEIYITHLHGDHIFGLHGLLCSLNEVRTESLNIYGPKGLKSYIDPIRSFVYNYNLHIHEFNKGYEHSVISRVSSGNYEYVVQLAFVSHGVLCFAYKITQVRKKHQLDMKRFFPHMDIYRDEIGELGFSPPIKIIDTLKNNIKVTMNDGFVFNFENYQVKENDVSLIIALDNYDSRKMQFYFRECDVLIHECTYSCFPSYSDEEVKETYKLAASHYHTTNRHAVERANKLSANTLILTHFSNRYSFDDEPLIIEDTKKHSSIADITVECARDFSEFCICSK